MLLYFCRYTKKHALQRQEDCLYSNLNCFFKWSYFIFTRAQFVAWMKSVLQSLRRQTKKGSFWLSLTNWVSSANVQFVCFRFCTSLCVSKCETKLRNIKHFFFSHYGFRSQWSMKLKCILLNAQLSECKWFLMRE